jgi:hypothetical protein
MITAERQRSSIKPMPVAQRWRSNGGAAQLIMTLPQVSAV